MLRSLHIRNFVLIDSLDIDFPEGLIIITGQTGAGKSILLGALSLVGGGRADASNISPGADSCVVEAEYQLSDTDTVVRTLLEHNDLDWDGGRLIVRRTLNASGRSRCFVNDSPVGVSLLGELSSRLIDIHSQHQSLLLTDRQFQLSLLDHYALNGERLEKCRNLWRRRRALESELDEARDRMKRMGEDREYNQALFDQLDKAALKQGELEELEEEQKRLANAESIKESLAAAMSALMPYGDDNTVTAGLKEAQVSLDKVSGFIPALRDFSSRLESARIELDDIISGIEEADSHVEVSPDRLRQVEDRMSLLYSLMRRHSCSNVRELMELRDKYSESLFDSTRLQQRINSLEKELSAAVESHLEACAGLHDARLEKCGELGASITAALHSLELDRAVFSVALNESQPGENGSDAVTFLFTATGINPVEVSRCASGGEMSRIMLCLKQMMAHYAGMPTMIFDEIDTGVSGSVADRMGSMICSMGRDMQVFAITHLPQVAAKGDAHYVVTKSIGADGRASSSIERLDRQGRVNEIARLLSGTTVTAEALANARILLSDAD